MQDSSTLTTTVRARPLGDNHDRCVCTSHRVAGLYGGCSLLQLPPMRPGQRYRAVSRNRIAPSTANVSETRIPLGPLTTVDMRDHAGRKGRAQQKIGLWGTVSPYYKTSATIDIRWSETLSNQGAHK